MEYGPYLHNDICLLCTIYPYPEINKKIHHFKNFKNKLHQFEKFAWDLKNIISIFFKYIKSISLYLSY